MIKILALAIYAVTNYSPIPVINNYLPAHDIHVDPKVEQVELQNLSKSAPMLDKKVIKFALRAYNKAAEQGIVKNPVLTVIDFSVPSNQQRMWIFDMNTETLVFKTFVAHGRNSGAGKVPDHFSNTQDSKKSSLGTYITKGTYMGNNGYSLNLEGLEKGLNSNAFDRRVVVHGAKYVEPNYIDKNGRAGRSWGCPAVADSLAKPVINAIKNGSVLFAYYPDSYFLAHSEYIAA